MSSQDKDDSKTEQRRLHEEDPEKYSDASSSSDESDDDGDVVDGAQALDDDFIRRMIQMRLMGADSQQQQGEKPKVVNIRLRVFLSVTLSF